MIAPGTGKVLLAMSGGVDSSVAAALLLRAGYEVVGCFMRLGSPGETLDELQPDDAACEAGACATGMRGGRLRIGHQGCCSINDAADARLVAAKLGIPFYVCNFKREFGRIIDHFVAEYNAGRTPNPCIRCNDWLKFGKLHDYAAQVGADFVASGHYARVERGVEGSRLLRGIDHDKDQSYVLFGVGRQRLEHMLLPIGALRKPEVRALAREFDLPVFDKPDSQEICFVPDNDYAGLVDRRTPGGLRPGAILDREGRVVGEHPGHQHFTIGQRRGLGVALGHPIYVIERDAVANTITVGPREALERDRCVAGEVTWLVDPPRSGAGAGDGDTEQWIPCTAQIRYNADAVPARVRVRSEDTIEVRFNSPQCAVAPGQAVVCYDGDTVLCGGWIG